MSRGEANASHCHLFPGPPFDSVFGAERLVVSKHRSATGRSRGAAKHVSRVLGEARELAASIKELAFYWGSVDPGNKITFTDWDGTATTFYGASFYNVPDPSNPGLYHLSNLTSQANPNNSASYGFDFKTSRAWNSVTFSSCDYTYNSGTNSFTPDCNSARAAFEFDNLEWSYPATCCSGPIGGAMRRCLNRPNFLY